ncbi:MAG: malonyl-CoA decarboxylase [Amphritea sp.]|nr:malonyl-CoA decarboxylase [Amphritea sp.]
MAATARPHSSGVSGSSLLGRTLKRLQRLWREPESTAQLTPLQLSPELNSEDLDKLTEWMDACLRKDGDSVTARNRAAVLGRNYLSLSDEGRLRFLMLLAERYDLDHQAVEQSFQHWSQAEPEQKYEADQQLREALEPPRLRLLTQFSSLPEGVRFLVDMRADLLRLRQDYPQLAGLEADLKRLLISWFDIGLLQLEQLSWQSSAEVLEKLIAYEAVHAIQSWDDLKNRLDSDRRCFAFFHPSMPAEPLIFVEVALVQGLADNVQQLLDQDAPSLEPEQADTAIFYSISNAQPGLAGISFGNFLIKQVVNLLQKDLPGLQQFSTLSPIPGFCRWLEQQDKTTLEQLPGGALLNSLPEPHSPDQKDYREALIGLVTHYLSQASGKKHFARDPVAHFHLSNGARIEQINWQADISERGLRQSAGLMVNYLYQLPHIEARSQQYILLGERAIAPDLNNYLKP